MKGQYDYKFQNFDTEEKKDPRSRIDSTSLQMKTSLDQDLNPSQKQVKTSFKLTTLRK